MSVYVLSECGLECTCVRLTNPLNKYQREGLIRRNVRCFVHRRGRREALQVSTLFDPLSPLLIAGPLACASINRALAIRHVFSSSSTLSCTNYMAV